MPKGTTLSDRSDNDACCRQHENCNWERQGWYRDEESMASVFLVPSVLLMKNPSKPKMRQRSSCTNSELEAECLQKMCKYCRKSAVHPCVMLSHVRNDVTRELQKICGTLRHDVIYCALWCQERVTENPQHVPSWCHPLNTMTSLGGVLCHMIFFLPSDCRRWNLQIIRVIFS